MTTPWSRLPFTWLIPTLLPAFNNLPTLGGWWTQGFSNFTHLCFRLTKCHWLFQLFFFFRTVNSKQISLTRMRSTRPSVQIITLTLTKSPDVRLLFLITASSLVITTKLANRYMLHKNNLSTVEGRFLDVRLFGSLKFAKYMDLEKCDIKKFWSILFLIFLNAGNLI